MKTVFHAADSRGDAEHGWLKAVIPLALQSIMIHSVWALVCFVSLMMIVLKAEWALADIRIKIWKLFHCL